MKNSMLRLLIACFVIALVSAMLLAKQLRHAKEEADRLGSNQAALLDSVKHYKACDSLNAATAKTLALTVSELKRHRSRDAEIIAGLGIEAKRVQSIASTATEAVHEVYVPIVERVVIKDTLPTDTLRCLSYSSAWLDIEGCSDKSGQFIGRVTSRDCVDVVAHIVPHKFLFIKWGQKRVDYELLSRNPNSRIVDFRVTTISR